ncbi:hypothetical protein M432DRAFT_166983 [Thermoascus aurantiacus ATCC 26904]
MSSVSTLRFDPSSCNFVRRKQSTGRLDPNQRDHNGRTPLHVAATKGLISIATSLLKIQGIEADAEDRDGFTPLHTTAWYGRSEVTPIPSGDRRAVPSKHLSTLQHSTIIIIFITPKCPKRFHVSMASGRHDSVIYYHTLST